MTALGAFSSGDVLTAADLNAIGTWTNYTPNVRASIGTLTTVAVYEAKYTQINDIVLGTLFFKITNVGTGAGTPIFDLPVAWGGYAVGQTADSGIGWGRENQITGNMLMVFARSTDALINNYNNTGPIAANFGCGVGFMYRTA